MERDKSKSEKWVKEGYDRAASLLLLIVWNREFQQLYSSPREIALSKIPTCVSHQLVERDIKRDI